MSRHFKRQIVPLFRFSFPVNLPLWLCAIPDSKLSYEAKILYGRLCVLCNVNGIVITNFLDLTQKIGMNKNKAKSAINELIESELIEKIKEDEEYSFEFYAHKWMDGQYDDCDE